MKWRIHFFLEIGITYVFPLMILKETALNVFVLVYHVSLICVLYVTRVTSEWLTNITLLVLMLTRRFFCFKGTNIQSFIDASTFGSSNNLWSTTIVDIYKLVGNSYGW